MKKVAFYLKNFNIGGIESSLVQYLANIDTDNHKISLIIGFKSQDKNAMLDMIPDDIERKFILKKELITETGTLTKFINQLYYKGVLRPCAKIFYPIKLYSILRKFDTVVDYGLTLGFIAKMLSVRKITYFHFRISQHYVVNRVSKRYTKILPYYDNIVVVSKKTLQDAKNIFPHCANKFILLYNQFDYQKIETLANKSIVNPLLTEEFIVSVGRLSEDQKDFSTLITAYNSLVEENKITAKLIIVGDGKDRAMLQDKINNYNLQEKIIMLGGQSNPFVWMKHAKALILSSKHEGLGGVLIEAMALACPVIATNCPDGPDEVLLNGLAGTLVPVGDYKKMADAIYRVLTDSDYRHKQLHEAAAQKSRFDVKQNISKLIELL